MRPALLLSVLIAGSALLGNGAAAFHPTLHCAGGLVDEGDSTGKLVNLCGPPTSIDKQEGQYRTEPVYQERTVYSYDGPNTTPRAQRVERFQSGTRTITVVEPHEIWYYNFGPGNFVAYIHIGGDRIGKIVKGGYGN